MLLKRTNFITVSVMRTDYITMSVKGTISISIFMKRTDSFPSFWREYIQYKVYEGSNIDLYLWTGQIREHVYEHNIFYYHYITMFVGGINTSTMHVKRTYSMFVSSKGTLPRLWRKQISLLCLRREQTACFEENKSNKNVCEHVISIIESLNNHVSEENKLFPCLRRKQVRNNVCRENGLHCYVCEEDNFYNHGMEENTLVIMSVKGTYYITMSVIRTIL